VLKARCVGDLPVDSIIGPGAEGTALWRSVAGK
jgi:hypothetical protein